MVRTAFSQRNCTGFVFIYALFCSDYNFVNQDGKCVPVGPEPIPAGECRTGDTSKTFMGSSGYRLIPGNTCDASAGIKKDDPVEKPCSQGMLLMSPDETRY